MREEGRRREGEEGWPSAMCDLNRVGWITDVRFVQHGVSELNAHFLLDVPLLPTQTNQCDVVSCGSQVNPSVSVAMFVHGAISFPGAIVRILAQLAAGMIAYPLLQKLSPSYVGVGGPGLQDGISTTTGALAEFTLTFGLLTLIYLAITIIGAPGQVGDGGGPSVWWLGRGREGTGGREERCCSTI